MQVYNEPWKHYVFENFFDEKLLEQCRLYSYSIKCKPKDRQLSFAFPGQKIYQDIKYQFIKKYESLGYSVEKDQNLQVEFSVCGKDYNYNRIHCDSVEKIFTAVVYLSDTGVGTKLYTTEQKSSYHSTVDWKVNRAIGFHRTDNSWHDFGNFGVKEPRRTLALILGK